MHLALYRKYRSKTFDEVVGQEHVTTTLKNEVAQGKPAHAYLFTGSRGTGKTSCAKIMAKALNCQNPKEGNPCGICDLCRGVDDGSMLDVVEIDAASNNGVDNIRDLRDEANFTPAMGKYRVYIIDEAHMLSTGAFNALLKIMEEPPAHVIFILATTEVHKVPATILSRCQRFDFKRIAGEEIAAHLTKVAGMEEIILSEDAALLIAHLSDGGMRDALSLLDLCSSFSKEVDLKAVTQAAGVAGQDHLFELAQAIHSKQAGAAIGVIDALSSSSLDPERLCEQLISHYRNLMIARAVSQPGDLVDCLPGDLERLTLQGKQYSLEELLYILTQLQDTLGRMSRTNLRRAELEMAMIRLCSPSLTVSTEALLARIEALETAVRTGGGVAAISTSPKAAPPPRPEASESGQAPPRVEQLPSAPAALISRQEPPPDMAQVPFPLEEPVGGDAPPPRTPSPQSPLAEEGGKPQRLAQWPEILSRLERQNPALHGALVHSTAYVRGGYVLVDYKDELFLKLIRGNEYAKESLKQAIFETTGKKYNLGPYREEQYAVAEEKDPLEAFVENLSLPKDQITIK